MRRRHPAKAGIQYVAASRSGTDAREYWVARSSRALQLASLQAAGTGSAVTDLIFSMAKREVTFLSGTALISFL